MNKSPKSIFLWTFFYIICPVGIVFLLGNAYSFIRLKQLKGSAYRAHDAFTVSRSATYQKDINTTYKMLHGDLCEIAGYPKSAVRCPFSEGIRKHNFVTDSLGFKTLGNNKTAKYILVGDSYLASSGGENMEQQLDYRLSKLLDSPVSAAAHPGDLKHYIQRIDLLSKYNKNAKYIILLFEGNDLTQVESSNNTDANNLTSFNTSLSFFPALAGKYSKKIEREIGNMPLVKLLKIYLSPVNASSNKIDTINVKINIINGQPQAFYKPQNDASINNGSLGSFINDIIARKEKICEIVFVPTAFSTYLTSATLKDRHPALARESILLNSSGISFVDLTPVFQAEARKNVADRLYWTDDTHWNSNGINLAAKTILSQSKCLK